VRIDIVCASCGSNRFSIDRAAADDTRIRCDDCTHEIGTLAELKERVAEEVLRRARPSQPAAD
jgi:hypothetical protein